MSISRRRFMKMAGAGIPGAWLAFHGSARAMMSGMGGMTGSGTTVINPPPGAIYADPPDARSFMSHDGFREYSLAAVEADVTIGGSPLRLMTYHDVNMYEGKVGYPGPVIRAARGDKLRVRLANTLPMTTDTNILGHTKNVTNLHTHGLHVSPSGKADNMMIHLMPGDEPFSYEYDLAFEEPGHLCFYHPHVHGVVAEQFWAGLAAPLLVEDPPGSPLSSYERHIMVLKDITISGGAPAPYTSISEYMHGREGSSVLVNGEVNPVLPLRPGQVQRWQIVNASTARFYKLSLEKHSLYVVGSDGGLLDKPYQVSSLLLSPGERVDVLVKGGAAGTYRFLSLPYSRGGMSTLQQVTLLTASIGGAPARDALPASVNSAARRIAVNTAALPYRRLELSMMMGKGYINGKTFVSMDNAATITSVRGTTARPSYEVWEIINSSGMDHPFHQHVNAAQVLSITGGDSAYAGFYTKTPAWKDVVVVPKMGSVKLLVPVLDYAGMTMFHCHIIEHEDIGMMGVWNIG